MGTFFEKTYIRGKNSIIYESWVNNAAKDIGYTKSVDGKGVPVRVVVYGGNTEWFGLDSPLLQTGDEKAETFAKALSREFKAPVLKISCVDSDFAICCLADGVSGSETAACINEPYEGIELPPADPAAWVAACKKKWKCREEQFAQVFSGEYAFAEAGLEKLAGLIQLPKESLGPEEPEDRCVAREFWVMPEAEFEAEPIPRTLEERLAAYIDETYAERLTHLGYKRFGGSSLRWHKVFGEEGRELIASIVFVVRYGYEINIFYGVQAVCCPLVLSDKYYPMHDHRVYWLDAAFEFPKHMGYDPIWVKIDGVDHCFPLNEPKTIDPYVDKFILKQLEAVRGIASLRFFTKKNYDLYTQRDLYGFGFAYRMFVEALLDGDEHQAPKHAEKAYKKYDELLKIPTEQKGVEAQQLTQLPELYLKEGGHACLEALKKVRDANMRKLKKAGVVR